VPDARAGSSDVRVVPKSNSHSTPPVQLTNSRLTHGPQACLTLTPTFSLLTQHNFPSHSAAAASTKQLLRNSIGRCRLHRITVTSNTCKAAALPSHSPPCVPATPWRRTDREVSRWSDIAEIMCDSSRAQRIMLLVPQKLLITQWLCLLGATCTRTFIQTWCIPPHIVYTIGTRLPG
jgi:hypothetical protein